MFDCVDLWTQRLLLRLILKDKLVVRGKVVVDVRSVLFAYEVIVFESISPRNHVPAIPSLDVLQQSGL